MDWSVTESLYSLVCSSLCLSLVTSGSALVLLLTFYLVIKSKAAKVRAGQPQEGLSVGFFHPYCNAGGGGERVLWQAVRVTQTRWPAARIVIYTGDTEAAPDMILTKARDRFNMNITDRNLEFIYLHKRRFVEAHYYPHFTMLGQSLGSIVLGVEALLSFVPSIYIDTMGYSFTMPLFKYCGGSLTGAYVHYPTISTDMLDQVKSKRSSYNNRGFIARSPLVSGLKLRYYKIFAWLYGMCGRVADTVMVNSSWTEEHIRALWGRSGEAGGVAEGCVKVFPPCDTSHLQHIARDEDAAGGQMRILSLGQFRPEKDHVLQIKAMFELRQILSEEDWAKTRLVIIGGCRGQDDWKLLQDLKDLSKHFSVEDNVEFHPNLPFKDLLAEFGKATIGIHTMWNEHFGIGIVEMMAAGLLTIAHRSGGPLMDIITEEAGTRNGFLAVTAQEYAAHIAFIISMTEEARECVRERAATSSEMFNSDQFDRGWIRATDHLFAGN